MIRGSGNVGLLKRERLDARGSFPTPGDDRVRDGRQLLHQDDADHAPPYDAIRISGGPLVSAILARELMRSGVLHPVSRVHELERA